MDISFSQTPGLIQRMSKNQILGVILGLAVVSFLPDFRSSVLPLHDSLQEQCAFQLYYSSLIHENALPLWLPYGEYGIVSVVLMMLISPTGYIAGLLGKAIGMTDTVLLFKFVVLFELLFFCYGTFKLSTHLFRRNESVLFVGIGAVLSFNWLMCLAWNFRSYYMLPFILLNLTLFWETGIFRYILYAGIFAVVSCIGNLPYYPPLLALLLFLYSVPMFKRQRLVFKWSDLPHLAFMFTIASVYAGFWIFNFTQLTGFIPGRDPVSKTVYQSVFLTFGGVSKARWLAFALFTPVYTHGDITYYIGIAPLILFAIAFWKCRSREFMAIAIIAVFLALFSFGGVVAFLAYYFPGMCYFRHVSLVFGQAKFLILIGGAFGLDRLLSDPALPHLGYGNCTKSTLIKSILLVLAIVELIVSQVIGGPGWGFALYSEMEDLTQVAAAAILVVFFYAICLVVVPRLKWRKLMLVHLLLIAYFLDVGFFKALSVEGWPLANDERQALSAMIFKPSKMAYVARREDAAVLLQSHPELNFFSFKFANSIAYSYVFNLVGLDPVIPKFKTDLLTSSVAEFFTSNQIRFKQFPSAQILIVPGVNITKILDTLGYGLPKLRVINGSGEISVTGFGPNYLRATVFAMGAEPQLFYADAFHPGWRATVNGLEVPVIRSQIAFKSISLQPGQNNVEFRFYNNYGSDCLYGLLIISLIFPAYLLFVSYTRITVP